MLRPCQASHLATMPRTAAFLPIATGICLGLLTLSAPRAEARNQPAAHALVREVEQSAASIRVELRSARDANGASRARCVSGKLSEAHAQLRQARTHAAAIAAGGTTASLRKHRYLLEAAHERSRELAQAARRCDAPPASFVRVLRR